MAESLGVRHALRSSGRATQPERRVLREWLQVIDKPRRQGKNAGGGLADFAETRARHAQESPLGAKTWMLIYADCDPRQALGVRPELDREATQSLAKALFPGETLKIVGDGDLSYTCPPDDEIHIGRFAGVSIVAAKEFGIDYPSTLPARFLSEAPNAKVYLHAMHSVVDWFAYAHWNQGKLVRSLSLSPDSGVLEDIGERLPFEEPYWAGKYPAVDPDEEPISYPFPFHPLDLGEAALRELFGYQLEGCIDPNLLEPESIPLMCFKRSRPKWKFWR